MSTAYSSQYYAATQPMPVPSKEDYDGYYQSGHSSYSVSPPEYSEHGSSTSGAASYGNSGYSGYSGYSATASYAGSSQGDYDSSLSANNIDLNEYMQDRFSENFNPIPLDRCMVTQAKTSGTLNAKHRELLDLQKKAQARLAKTRARFDEGMQDAREVREDLEWTQKKVTSLKTKASKKHSKEHKKARERYPSPEY